MAEIPSQISFSKLISHTFPGIFVAIGIFMIIYMMFLDSIKNTFLMEDISESWTLFIGVFGSLIFVGTIIGIIIDAIHHLIEEFFLDEIIEGMEWSKKLNDQIKKEEDYLVKNLISNVLVSYEGKKFKWFYYLGFLPIEKLSYIDENYYCYQESLFNFSISFLFSSIIYSKFLYNLGYNSTIYGSIFIFFIVISILCFWSGLTFYLNLKLNRVYFVKGALDHLNQP